MKEVITVELGDKTYVLKLEEWDYELDVDEALKIDYYNILGENLTFPVLFNRIGKLQAEMDNACNVKKFKVDTLYSQLEEKYRTSLTEETTDSKGNKKISKPGVEEIKNAIKRDEEYIKEYTELLEFQKHQGIINSLYWSAKSKESNLKNISEKIKPEEFEGEIIEKTINGILIKKAENLIK